MMKSLKYRLSHELFVGLLAVLLVLISACGDNSPSKANRQASGISLPPQLLTAELQELGTLKAYASLDDGERQEMLINNNKASLNIANAAAGEHTLTIDVEYILNDNPSTPILVARSVVRVTVEEGQNEVFVPVSSYVFDFDLDEDGLNNKAELDNQSSPFDKDPVITTDANQSIFENENVVTTITAETSVIGNDQTPNGDGLSFSIVEEQDHALFEIDADGELKFINAPDFENPVNEDNTYQVRVQVTKPMTGGSAQNDKLLTVSVEDGFDLQVSGEPKKVVVEWRHPENYIPLDGYILTELTNGDNSNQIATFLFEDMTTYRHSYDVSVHLYRWESTQLQLEALGRDTDSLSTPLQSFNNYGASSIGKLCLVKAPDSAAECDANIIDELGTSISISHDGSTIAVGVPGDNDNGNPHNVDEPPMSNSGAVYIYSRGSDDSWSYKTKLKAPSINENDYFGASVSLNANGTIIAVGAPGTDYNNLTDAGRVYIYEKNNLNWLLPTNNNISSPNNNSSNQLFGIGVSLSADGTVLATTASTKPILPIENDTAYVFTYDRGIWEDTELSRPQDFPTLINYPIQLSGDGNTIAITTANIDVRSNPPEFRKENVYTYHRNNRNMNWSGPTPVNSVNLEESGFGMSLSLSYNGQILAVGAPLDDSDYSGIVSANDLILNNNATDSGAVYLYRFSNGNPHSWDFTNYIKAHTPSNNNFFGSCVSLGRNGRLLSVGAPKENGTFPEGQTIGARSSFPEQNEGSGPGANFVYIKSDDVESPTYNQWREHTYLKANEVTTGFGTNCALGGILQTTADTSGSTLVVGNDSGTIYLY